MPVRVDLTNFHEIVGKDNDLEKELFNDFIEKSQENLRGMRASLQTGDRAMWKENAHMMKGACKSLGAFDLADLMAMAETCPTEEKMELYAQILVSFDDVRSFLTAQMDGKDRDSHTS